MSKNNKKKNAAAETQTVKTSKSSTAAVQTPLKLSMHEKFADLFVISMFSIFPIYMTNKLFSVRKDRLQYFVVTTFILLFFIMATYICGIDKERWPKKLFKFSVSDISIIAFTGVCLISALLSKYGQEAFTGSGGRDSGFWLMAVYLLCYLLISRYFGYREEVFAVFAVMSSVICLIGVMHEFWVDPMNIINDIKEEQQKDFISTIGNINMFSGFVCASLPVCTVLAVLAKDKLFAAFYYATVAFNFMGLLVANSLGGYFGFTVFMAILFVYCCGSAKRFFRFCITITTMLATAKLMRVISFIFKDNYKNLEDISHFLVYDNRVFILIGISVMITVGAYLLYSKKGDEHSPKWVQIIAGSVVGLTAAGVLGVFIYFSAVDKTTDLGKLSKILRFNDSWGTHRGYAWIRGFKLFHSNGIKNILVGSGPDTFGQVIKEVYRDDMIKRHNSVFDSAHNEFLNYLVTTGILGFAAYVTLIVSLIVRCAKRCKGEYALRFMVVIMAITAYCAQSVFNLATPIITPFIFLFFALSEALIRSYDVENA